jgi:hypothetical protein
MSCIRRLCFLHFLEVFYSFQLLKQSPLIPVLRLSWVIGLVLHLASITLAFGLFDHQLLLGLATIGRSISATFLMNQLLSRAQQ